MRTTFFGCKYNYFRIISVFFLQIFYFIRIVLRCFFSTFLLMALKMATFLKYVTRKTMEANSCHNSAKVHGNINRFDFLSRSLSNSSRSNFPLFINGNLHVNEPCGLGGQWMQPFLLQWWLFCILHNFDPFSQISEHTKSKRMNKEHKREHTSHSICYIRHHSLRTNTIYTKTQAYHFFSAWLYSCPIWFVCIKFGNFTINSFIRPLSVTARRWSMCAVKMRLFLSQNTKNRIWFNFMLKTKTK